MGNWAAGTALLTLLIILSALNVAQSWNYRQHERALAQLEKDQNDIYEQNKRLLAAIAELEAPERLMQLVAEKPEWRLRRLRAADILKIKAEKS